MSVTDVIFYEDLFGAPFTGGIYVSTTTSTYKKVEVRSNRQAQKQLVSLLTKLKELVVSTDCAGNKVKGLPKDEYWKLHPTFDNILRYYGLPKIHKAAIPLRLIISSIGSITDDTANLLQIGRLCYCTVSKSSIPCVYRYS